VRSRRISILVFLLLLCICSSCVVAGSLPVKVKGVSPGQDLIKKFSLDSPVGIKGDPASDRSTANIVTVGQDTRLIAWPIVLHRNISCTILGYATPIAGPWSNISRSLDPVGVDGIITGTGTIRRIGLQGGLFGIITDDGNHYLPSNLPGTYAEDGLRVAFKAYTMPVNPAFRMWGAPLRIISIVPEPTKEAIIETTGTVTWVALEGGFYGITADDGTRYDPLNLPDEYEHEGFRIGFTAIEDPDMASIHQWGTIVTITGAMPISHDGTYLKAVLVDYKRTGGLAGFDDHLTVYENGVTIVTTKDQGGRYMLSTDEMNDLISLFESSGFNSVNQNDLPLFKVSGNDFFSYSIEFKGHKIEAIEYALPESLNPVIERLNNLVLGNMPDKNPALISDNFVLK